MSEIIGKPPELGKVFRLLGGALIWPALAFLVVAIFLFATIRIGHVTGEEVGIVLNKITGDITVLDQSGVKIYNGFTQEFYVLDKTMQTLDMTQVLGRGDRSEKDDLKIKTKDGSDVYVDLKVQYRLIADMADIVIRTSGPNDNYKEKWARDYVRSTVRNYLGELTTEEFYDSSKRNVKLINAEAAINESLADYGLKVDSLVIPSRPKFYEEYEEMIKKKKLADQGVLEEQSKALAAKQRQETEIVTETNVKNVAIEQFKGEMEQLVIAAEAEAERARKEADAYMTRASVGAEATLYSLTQEAEGITVQKAAEAKGIEALRKALEGEGGRNMVKMEYARKLANMTITGQPYTTQGTIERFEHLKGPAAQGRITSKENTQ